MSVDADQVLDAELLTVDEQPTTLRAHLPGQQRGQQRMLVVAFVRHFG